MLIFVLFFIVLSSGYLRGIFGIKRKLILCIKETTVFMYRRSKTIEWRNREIYAEFCAHLRNGMPTMQAYAACAHKYDLDEDSIRKIVRNQAKCK